MLTLTEAELALVFKGIGQSPSTRLAGNLVETIGKHGSMPKAILYKMVFRLATHTEFDIALLSAIMAGKLRQTSDGVVHSAS